jgi:hypothetical protein
LLLVGKAMKIAGSNAAPGLFRLSRQSLRSLCMRGRLRQSRDP